MFCYLAFAKVETNLMDAVGIDNNKIVSRSSLRIYATVANTMTELNAEADLL
jgi:hypothetical protein